MPVKRDVLPAQNACASVPRAYASRSAAAAGRAIVCSRVDGRVPSTSRGCAQRALQDVTNSATRVGECRGDRLLNT
eukprot:3906277-Pleurochrysis_carterae.AAC.1